MSVTSFDPNQDIAITAPAKSHLLEQIQKSKHQALRLGIKESGCNGYMYTIDFIDATNPDDVKIELTGEFSLYISSEDMPIIRGTTVDYVRDGLNAALKFKNPNAQSHCGCGESFSVAEAH